MQQPVRRRQAQGPSVTIRLTGMLDATLWSPQPLSLGLNRDEAGCATSCSFLLLHKGRGAPRASAANPRDGWCG